MSVKNSERVGPGVLNVLGTILIRTPGPWWWHSADIEEHGARGAIFRAYEEGGTHDIAYLLVVDVTEDPTEPDVTLIRPDTVGDFDEKIRVGVSAQLNVTKWMSSHLNTLAGQNALITAYIIQDVSGDRQIIAVRRPVANRKYLIMGCFVVTRAQELARPIFEAIHVQLVPPDTSQENSRPSGPVL